MSRNYTIDIDLEDEIIDDFGELESEKKTITKNTKAAVRPIHAEWDIVKAFNAVNENAPKSRLSHDFLVKCAEALNYLSEKLGLNTIQCVVVAMLIEEGEPMTLKEMGRELGLTHLSMMTYHNDIEELFKKRWLNHKKAQTDGQDNEYTLAKGVVCAIRENRVFEAEALECATQQEFVEKLANHFVCGFHHTDTDFEDERIWIEQLVEANKTLPICKAALELGDYDMALLMMLVCDYYKYKDSEDEGLCPSDIELLYTTTGFFEIARMQRGIHPLFQKGYVTHKCDGGIADTNCYVVSDYLKNELLADVVVASHSEGSIPTMNGMKSYKDITEKPLFYNDSERKQIERLGSILSQEQLPIIQGRLKEKGMRTGVCVLMHGYPGTGKTATAYELARQTGRDIIQVQVTDFLNKYVGESEANLKQIFSKYRTICKNSETMPILLLNEGDAILSKRKENVEHSTEQMMNSLQNILLEEMENLEGIMIVTTNLTSNLDKAFERRFIFKIQFEKPSIEVKAQIWQSMIDTLKPKDATELAHLYDVTGGEIENIARKSTMEYILTGVEADLETIKMFTEQEKLESSHKNKIGFTH